ncbi:MAG: transglutaminase family protein [Caldilineaceae bacterium]|nr:transglutaminase family protein [Caldilineaceae bacterium]
MSPFVPGYHPAQIPLRFLDHHTVDWSRVQRSDYLIHQRVSYDYPSPARELRHRLVVVPADQHGQQRLYDYKIQVFPAALSQEERIDEFGNRILDFYLPEVADTLVFEVWSTLQQQVGNATRPRVAAGQAHDYLQPTRLTAIDEKLTAVAAQLRQQHAEPYQLADAINRWVYGAMRYERGLTVVTTTAAEALALGGGLCQDFAHVMLAICRAAGLPARYVSGHLLGEGGSHAWVEVLLPATPAAAAGSDRIAWAFDPTNHCLATHNYITIAVGRDYADVSPTSGSFFAAAPGQLAIRKRAGLTAVAYADGEVVRAEDGA